LITSCDTWDGKDKRWIEENRRRTADQPRQNANLPALPGVRVRRRLSLAISTLVSAMETADRKVRLGQPDRV